MGSLVLMGSGELSPSMVEVHKALLHAKGPGASAVFIDTPAGFQPNVDDISRRAQDYFSTRVGRPLEVASLKSRKDMETLQGRHALKLMASADYLLMGPGSPTYAARQWIGSPVPEILRSRIHDGAVVAAASAAALTVGWKTLPVYEIYKVGMDLHWADGMDLLGPWGFRLVVVPHWNNAEGGTHDTRFCYMGEERFRILERLLPWDAIVVGIDEHTALVVDFARNRAEVRGLGTVTLRKPPGPGSPIMPASTESGTPPALSLGDAIAQARGPALSERVGEKGAVPGMERIFRTGETFPLDLLRDFSTAAAPTQDLKEPLASPWARDDEPPAGRDEPTPEPEGSAAPSEEDFWGEVRRLESAFEQGLEDRLPENAARGLLELDRLLWDALRHGAAPEDLSQGRELFREWIVLAAQRLPLSPRDTHAVLSPLVDDLVRLRGRLREKRLWDAADAVRSLLASYGVVVEDTPTGSRWRWTHE